MRIDASVPEFIWQFANMYCPQVPENPQAVPPIRVQMIPLIFFCFCDI